MPNNYFQFKNFLIKQDKCALKVCTDACLFGAWAADKINNERLFINTVLDIGCGTGLLSLMLAQKCTASVINAVEIDEAAAQQAKENFDASQWKRQLNVFNTSIQKFSAHANKYDLIITNPPFYENDLKSVDLKRNLALHSSDLKLEELIFIADELLSETGNFFVLLPHQRTQEFEDLILKHHLKLKEKIFIRQTSEHPFFRTIFWIDRNSSTHHQTEIIIKNHNYNYSKEFTNLLKDYYLHLQQF